MEHIVNLTNGSKLSLVEENNSLNISAVNDDGTVAAYLLSLTPTGVIVAHNSGAEQESVSQGLKQGSSGKVTTLTGYIVNDRNTPRVFATLWDTEFDYRPGPSGNWFWVPDYRTKQLEEFLDNNDIPIEKVDDTNLVGNSW